MSQDPYAKQALFVKIGLAVAVVFVAIVAYTMLSTSDEEKARFNNDMNQIEQTNK